MEEELSKLKERHSAFLSYQDYCSRLETMRTLNKLAENSGIAFNGTGSPKVMDIGEREKQLRTFQLLLDKYTSNGYELGQIEKNFIQVSRTLEQEDRKLSEAKTNKIRRVELEAQMEGLQRGLQQQSLVNICLNNLKQI